MTVSIRREVGAEFRDIEVSYNCRPYLVAGVLNWFARGDTDKPEYPEHEQLLSEEELPVELRTWSADVQVPTGRPSLFPTNWECSHRCRHVSWQRIGGIRMQVVREIKTCCNPEHVLMESPAYNKSRIGCSAGGDCTHVPKCILADVPFDHLPAE
jgi:hypothetical protein